MDRPIGSPTTAPSHRAAERWGGDPLTLEHLGSSENEVYRVRCGDVARILRLTSPDHRCREQIAAELEFVRYLRDRSVRAAGPLKSRAVKEIELIDGWSAVLFEEAQGEPFRFDPAADNRGHFRTVGRTLGRIHSLSRTYLPDGGHRRFRWDEDPTLQLDSATRSTIDADVLREYDRLMEWLGGTAEDPSAFGLIHGDFGASNYLCNGEGEGGLSVFDFDDCCYHWYAYDLAIVIYPHGWRSEIRNLYEALIEGYSAEAEWDGRPLVEMTNWCSLRLLYMYLHARLRERAGKAPSDPAWIVRTRDNIARGYRFNL
jgi:Ser/Thr protein kinase RdoA (MazF antagonist)